MLIKYISVRFYLFSLLVSLMIFESNSRLWADVRGNSSTCLNCHQPMQSGFSLGHGFGQIECSDCHRGNDAGTTAEEAHANMYAFPGNLSNADETCGVCHPRQVESVKNHQMHRGSGMVEVTREVFDEISPAAEQNSLQTLANSPADSLLRKQCASCHLGQDKTRHELNVTSDRGGGCLACHINRNSKTRHPKLTIAVEDGRCFGCHSRSGRIALSYAGLAEVDPQLGHAQSQLARLEDGRLVERKTADIHQQAGLACIDCHTMRGLMGSAIDAEHQQQPVDISCNDCHNNKAERISLEQWPKAFESFKTRLPFTVVNRQRFLQTARFGSPLWSIEQRGDSYLLHRKLDGEVLSIPQFADSSHVLEQEHARLECSSCHSQWAPQCNGCHLRYEPSLKQWDHAQRKLTPGRWIESRWGITNNLPMLGVTDNDRISPFVPGMILSIEHPDWQEQKFKRRFAPLSAHTIGASRSCQSCHRSSVALGLGQGNLERGQGGWTFHSSKKVLPDGLAEDAWTTLDKADSELPNIKANRPFNLNEINRILNAEVPRFE
jgi:hypothetical protein